MHDLVGVNFDKIDERLAEGLQPTEHEPLNEKDGWRQSSITIGIPSGRKPTTASRREEATAQRRLQRHQHVADTPPSHPIPGLHYTIHGFWHKNLCAEIRQTLSSDPAARTFVYDPHFVEHRRRTAGSAEHVERVHGELYTSDAFVQEDLRLQNSPREPDCNLPRAIAALMFWSDATQVAQFGQAKVWPNYLYYGNQSKYERARPMMHAAHHVAYFPMLPDGVQDFIRHHTGKAATPQLLAHCRRELFHGAWACLLDAEFLHAYEHGMIIDCIDGVRHRIYPRIFTYSADYPEKVLIATVRDKGRCPCPRCLIKFEDIAQLGTEDDEENAFERIKGFNYNEMLVVDLLHEYELGIWKSLFAHLIRILEAAGGQGVEELNARFRQVPTFGRSTIRRFAHNVSEMKRMAARDLEDILQCVIPCIEGLLSSEHNDRILLLLYHVAYWHALAKLRLHTDTSLQLLSSSTVVLGRALRHFTSVTCAAFDTKESKAEYAARQRAQARRKMTSSMSAAVVGRRQRTFNLKVVKLHFLGDYVQCIKRYGTTDSYTTQIGEHEHRRIKARRKRTNFVQPDAQVVNMDIRAGGMRRIAHELHDHGIDVPGIVAPESRASLTDELAQLPLTDHHTVPKDQKNVVDLREWPREHVGDVAVTGFVSHLREHLAVRLQADVPDLPPFGADQIVISQDRIYRHATLHINYTTYDLQRDQDVIHIGTDKTGVLVLTHQPHMGSHSDNLYADSSRLDGSRTGGLRSDGSCTDDLRSEDPRADSSHSDGFHADTSRWDGSCIDGSRCNSSHTDSSRSEEPHADSSCSAGFRVNSTHSRSGRFRSDGSCVSNPNPRASDDASPWAYAEVLNIYHCHVTMRAGETVVSRRIDFLWVRWLDSADSPSHFGTHVSRLEHVQYVPFGDRGWAETFAFIDPATVIRGCHFIPAFHFGRTTTLLPPSLVRPVAGDWQFFYVNRFADRDMFIRHIGHSVSHLDLQQPIPEHIVPSDYEYDIPEVNEETTLGTGMADPVDDGNVGEGEAVDTSEEEEDELEGLGTDGIDDLTMSENTLIQQKGAMLGIVGDLFRDFAQIINAGIAANQDTPLTALSMSERRDLQLFRAIMACVPMISDQIAEHGPGHVDVVAQLLDRGRVSVRSTDLNSVKLAIAGWRTFNPPIPLDRSASKDLRGFNHPGCGKLLCPAKWDWSDENVRNGLHNCSAKYRLSAANLPNMLWEDERICDPKDMFKGFGRGPLLVTALRHSLLGPKVATAPSGTKIAARKPKAQVYRIRSITPGCIAYAAVLVHFALSSQETFNATGHGCKFNYEMFYQAIIQTIEELMLERERHALLAWWNGQIFNAQYNLEAELEDEEEEEDGEPSVFVQMREQARARREREERENRDEQDEREERLVDGTTTAGSAPVQEPATASTA
ncbi:hypothetical protein BN946_scf184839.g11 [Trametes cinnabarina]|uniref:Uncharacterized protein n=1 Tax=Pycnoporus cinnabarinus TaxID=5643 RepID=A0A060SIW3_PYCCI|nr:hypothetical protein BN946_scf184839.g11 [Trametes cinnabarina]